jgi:hypothetical protein
VLIFLEGSRFTTAKHRAQNGRYRNLLVPKAGGFGYVLDGLGERIERVVDVTLLYPDGVPTFWDFLRGRCPRVEVVIRHTAPPPQLLTAARRLGDGGRAEVQAWIDELWRRKDTLIDEVLTCDQRDHAPAPPHV